MPLGWRPRRRRCSTHRCPEGATTLVLAGEQLGVQIHESVGHAVELDRVLGGEASYAGTSCVPADGIGSLRYGSALMSVTADATLPGHSEASRWDDEGVAGARRYRSCAEGVLERLPLLARERRRDRPRALGWVHARGGLRAPADRPDDQREPRPRRRRNARRAAGRRRWRDLHRDQPVVVDRLPAAALPVRVRGRLGDRGRPARADAARPRLRRHHAGLLVRPGRASARPASGGSHRSRTAARASRARWRTCPTGARPLASAESGPGRRERLELARAQRWRRRRGTRSPRSPASAR